MPDFQWHREFPDEYSFPNLRRGHYRETSKPTDEYNCIAHAYGRNDTPMWPGADMREEGYWWPSHLPESADLPSFVALFKDMGYEDCADGASEDGYEKIALYVDLRGPTHAARQRPNGKWSSKLGPDIDIEHDTPAVLEGLGYGRAVAFLRRPLDATQKARIRRREAGARREIRRRHARRAKGR